MIGIIVVGPCAATGTGGAAYHVPPLFSAALGIDGEIGCGLRGYHEPPAVFCDGCSNPLQAPDFYPNQF